MYSPRQDTMESPTREIEECVLSRMLRVLVPREDTGLNAHAFSTTRPCTLVAKQSVWKSGSLFRVLRLPPLFFVRRRDDGGEERTYQISTTQTYTHTLTAIKYNGGKSRR